MKNTNKSEKPFSTLFMALLPVILSLVLPSGMALADSIEAKTWLEPGQLSKNNAQTDPPQIAMNEEGNGIAVWSQYKTTDFSYGIWVTQYTKNKGWGTPKRVSNTVGQASNPRVAINDNGDAIVVWTVFNFDTTPFSTVWANYYDHRNGWGKPVEIQNDAVDSYFPLVAIDQWGNAVAIWNQNNPDYDKTNIYANYFTHDNGWAHSEMIQSSEDLLSLDSDLSITNDGKIVAMWEQFDSTTEQPRSGLVTDIFTSGKGWEGPEFVTHDDPGSPTLAFNEKGNMLAVWTSMDPSTLQDTVKANWYQPDQGWSESQSVQSNPNINSDSVQATLDDNDQALIIWVGQEFTYFGENPVNLYSSSYTTATGWSSEEVVDQAAPYSEPKLATDEHGNAIAVSEVEVPGPNPYVFNYDIYAYRYSPSSGWGNKQNIENYDGESTSPQLVMSEDGDALAAWQQSDNTSGNTSIWANQFTSNE